MNDNGNVRNGRNVLNVGNIRDGASIRYVENFSNVRTDIKFLPFWNHKLEMISMFMGISRIVEC